MKKRAARALQIDPFVSKALVRVVAQRNGDLAPTLDVAKVVAVESALECVFTDDVLACFAARAFDLDGVLPLTRTAREQGLPNGYVAVWRFRRKSYVLVPKKPDDDDAAVFSIGLNENDPGLPTRGRLVYWLEQVATGAPAPSSDIRLTASLVVTKTPKKVPIVQHAKLGRGELLREENGKVEVRFADGVERTLIASAVVRVLK